jgi:cysteine desulfurase
MDAKGYFDNNATTPLDPRVREVMIPWLGELHGNPSSVHRFGRQAREAVERARDKVASLLGAQPLEVVFTASGTEAANAVVESCCRAGSGELLISELEHPSIQASAIRFEEAGGQVVRVRATSSGVVAVEAFAEAMSEQTSLVSLMLANNELGTIQPVAEVAALCRRHDVPLVCDAVQAVGKVEVDVQALGTDYLVVGAHKFHGPLGAAAVVVRGGRDLRPLLIGGGQERGRRAGTPNVAAIVGFGEACRLAEDELTERGARLAALRDRFESGLAEIRGAVVHCAAAPRLPNTSHIAFPGVAAEALLIRLDLAGFAVSTGSACSSGVIEASGALAALGLSDVEVRGSLRVSFGLMNDETEVDGLLAALGQALADLRASSEGAA